MRYRDVTKIFGALYGQDEFVRVDLVKKERVIVPAPHDAEEELQHASHINSLSPLLLLDKEAEGNGIRSAREKCDVKFEFSQLPFKSLGRLEPVGMRIILSW